MEAEMERMKHFEEFLRSEDKIVFEDMMNQCKLYASYASTLASPVREVPLIISILFAQHKMLWKHEKQLAGIESKKADLKPESNAAPESLAE